MALPPLTQATGLLGQLGVTTPLRSALSALVACLRPDQWTKNLLVSAGLVFGGRLFEPMAVVAAVCAFALFCSLSGSVYLVNDVR